MIWLLWAEISWIYWISWTSCPEYPGCATLASNLQGVWPAVWVGGDHLQLAGGWSGKALGCWLVLLLTTTASATNTSSSSTTTTTTTSSTTILLSTLHKLLLLTQAAAILLTLEELLSLNGGSGVREQFNWLRRGNDERQQWFQSKFDTSALKKVPFGHQWWRWKLGWVGSDNKCTNYAGENAEYMILTDNEYFAQRTSEFSSIPVHTLLFLSCSRLVQNCWYMLELLEHGGTVGGNGNSRPINNTDNTTHPLFWVFCTVCVYCNHSY